MPRHARSTKPITPGAPEKRCGSAHPQRRERRSSGQAIRRRRPQSSPSACGEWPTVSMCSLPRGSTSSARGRVPTLSRELPVTWAPAGSRPPERRRYWHDWMSLIAQLTEVGPPLVRARRAACAAECSRIGGAGDPRLWADAQRQWELRGSRYEAAYARLRGGEALLATGGNRGEAERLARGAHEIVQDLGARPLRDQLERLGRRARLDLGRPSEVEVAPNALLQQLELTPRELEVLALLADGMTNREIATALFISHKTASVHVSRILTKLSVPNRTAAAAAAQSLGVERADLPAAT